MKKVLISIVAVALLAGGWVWSQNRGSHKINDPAANQQTAGFNKKRYSLDDATSLWVIVNKKRALSPTSYTPSDLKTPDIPLRSNITSDEKQIRRVVVASLEEMAADAKQAGLTLTLESGYRSYDLQNRLYNLYVQQQGKTVADTQSARPGYSEHQTGLAFDLGGTSKPACNVEVCFAETAEGQWLAGNAYRYGFIIRYAKDKTDITGYMYEPWHLRYVGKELAGEMHKQGIQTLEEFFGTGAAPGY